MKTEQAGKKPATPNQVAIYALCDPRTGGMRYIGKANNPDARLKSHLRDARKRTTPVYRWINKLLREGVSPSMVVLAWTHDWRAEERALIAKHRAGGVRLLNVAEGGEEPACSHATRQANGRKVAACRDKLIWSYRRKLGQAIHWLEQNSTPERIQRLKDAARVFEMLDTARQRYIATVSARRAGEPV